MTERDGQRYEWLTSLANGSALSTFLRTRPSARLVLAVERLGAIDSEEYAEEPGCYGKMPSVTRRRSFAASFAHRSARFAGALAGIRCSASLPASGSLNFEDHDILKTAGRQVAAALAQALAQEKLTETRQFEALNRLSGFLMHDLKNIVAEQELVLANAQRFRHRPEFIDDAFATIRGGTERIKRVLQRLAGASRTKPPPGRVDVSKLLMEIRSQCADRQPIPEIDTQARPIFGCVWIAMSWRACFFISFGTLRTPRQPRDELVSRSKRARCTLITVTDTGCGMDRAFIRDRLFRRSKVRRCRRHGNGCLSSTAHRAARGWRPRRCERDWRRHDLSVRLPLAALSDATAAI